MQVFTNNIVDKQMKILYHYTNMVLLYKGTINETYVIQCNLPGRTARCKC